MDLSTAFGSTSPPLPRMAFQSCLCEVLDSNSYVHLHFACSSTLTLLNIARVALFVCSLTLANSSTLRITHIHENNPPVCCGSVYSSDIRLTFPTHFSRLTPSIDGLRFNGSPLLSVIPGGGDAKFVNFGTFPTLPFTRC